MSDYSTTDYDYNSSYNYRPRYRETTKTTCCVSIMVVCIIIILFVIGFAAFTFVKCGDEWNITGTFDTLNGSLKAKAKSVFMGGNSDDYEIL